MQTRQVHIRRSEVRRLLDPEAEGGDGVADLSKLDVQDREVVDGFDVIAPVLDRLLEVSASVVQPPLLGQDKAELVGGLGISGIQLQGSAQQPLRLGRISEAAPCLGRVNQCVRKIRIQVQGALEMLRGSQEVLAGHGQAA